MNRTKQWLPSVTALFIVKPAGGAGWFSSDALNRLATRSSATGRMAWSSPAAIDAAITGHSLRVLLTRLKRERPPYPGCSGGKSERSDWAPSSRSVGCPSMAMAGTWFYSIVWLHLARSLNQLLPPYRLGAARR